MYLSIFLPPNSNLKHQIFTLLRVTFPSNLKPLTFLGWAPAGSKMDHFLRSILEMLDVAATLVWEKC